MDDTVGIDVEEMKNIANLFIDYRNNISKIFNDYNEIINNTKLYFEGQVGDEFRKKFNLFSKELNTVITSLEDYANELYEITAQYEKNDISINENNTNNDFINSVK